jgi:hypothetical protein
MSLKKNSLLKANQIDEKFCAFGWFFDAGQIFEQMNYSLP